MFVAVLTYLVVTAFTGFSMILFGLDNWRKRKSRIKNEYTQHQNKYPISSLTVRKMIHIESIIFWHGSIDSCTGIA